MKKVRLIHHGESAANAGERTWGHSSIPLTAKSLEQAHLVALGLVPLPHRFCSPKARRSPQRPSIPQLSLRVVDLPAE